MSEITIYILCIIGLLLSIYAKLVERRKVRNRNYRAFCDFNNEISCSRAFTSKYGYHFGLSNSFFGMLFYSSLVILTFIGQIYLLFWLSILALVGSIYLALVLYFKLKDFCVVCTLVYLVNLGITIASYSR